MAQKPTGINLDGLSAEELKALAASAEAKFSEKQAEALDGLRAEIEEKVSALGTTVAELFGLNEPARPAKRFPKKGGTTLPAKFRTPDGQEWTGRGRKPNWLSAMEAEGTDVEQFRV